MEYGLWTCAICGGQSFDGKSGHAEHCWNHPDRRIIALERRIKELEETLDLHVRVTDKLLKDLRG